jgi:hypothetical protein
MQDAIPTYRPPHHILATRSKLTFATADTVSLDSIIQRLKRLNEIIAMEVLVRDLWSDVLFPLFHIFPILHDCLSMARGSLHGGVEIREKECYRLAAILYLCNMRAKFDFESGAGMLYGSKLYLMIGGLERSKILIWILTVAACSPSLFKDLRAQFVTLLSEAVKSAGIGNFREFSALISGLIWCDAALGEELRDLQGQIGLSG